MNGPDQSSGQKPPESGPVRIHFIDDVRITAPLAKHCIDSISFSIHQSVSRVCGETPSIGQFGGVSER